MKDNMEQFWDLSKPKMARDFLKNVRFGEHGSAITFLEQGDGTRVSINDASDAQVLQVAAELAEAFGKRGGVCK